MSLTYTCRVCGRSNTVDIKMAGEGGHYHYYPDVLTGVPCPNCGLTAHRKGRHYATSGVGVDP